MLSLTGCVKQTELSTDTLPTTVSGTGYVRYVDYALKTVKVNADAFYRLAAIIEKEISNEKYNKLKTNKNEKAD
jgi:hypothetical protein